MRFAWSAFCTSWNFTRLASSRNTFQHICTFPFPTPCVSVRSLSPALMSANFAGCPSFQYFVSASVEMTMPFSRID